MPVQITIDHLVLVGFDPRDREALSASIERAIAAHLDAASLRTHVATTTLVERVAAGDVGASTRAHRGDLGTRIGSAVARAIDGRLR
jgi:hypothetical protein